MTSSALPNVTVALNVEFFDADEGTLYLPSAIQKRHPPDATLDLQDDTIPASWQSK